MQALGTRKTLALHAAAFFRAEQLPVRWGKPGLPLLTDLGSSPHGPRPRHLGVRCVSFSICKMGPRAGIRPPPGTRGGRSPAGRRAGVRARGAGSGSPGRVRARGRRAGAGPRGPAGQPRGRGRGRGGAAHVASRTACRRLLQPSLVEPAPPWRARPLHKRPPRRRWRMPTCSDPPRVEEGAQRRRHSPPRLSRKSSPPSLPPLPPLTGNSCGLRATELAAVQAPPYRLLIGSGSPSPSVIGQ